VSLTVYHTIGELKRDLREIARTAPGELRGVVRDHIRIGNQLAKSYARASNHPDSHAQDYPGFFTARMNAGFRGAEVSVYSGEYGPLARGQGQLAHILENGEGSNAPQNNLARSTDVVGPMFAHRVGRTADGLFWP
jgi:hypothetical protein